MSVQTKEANFHVKNAFDLKSIFFFLFRVYLQKYECGMFLNIYFFIPSAYTKETYVNKTSRDSSRSVTRV